MKYSKKTWEKFSKNSINKGRRSFYRAKKFIKKEKCQYCGKTKNLHIHHKDANRENNTQENLVVLCQTCHGITHRKLNYLNSKVRRFSAVFKK